jgi:hypothetical protein
VVPAGLALGRRVPFGMQLAGVLGVLGRMQMVPMCEMRVVGCLVVRLVAVMFGGVAVVLGRGLVMFGGLFVVLGEFSRVHCDCPLGCAGGAPAARSDTNRVTVFRTLW